MDNADQPAVPVAPAMPAASVVPASPATSTGTMVSADWAKYDGKDAGAAMGKGVELCLISMLATFIILGIYYLALKVMVRMFPAKPE